MKNLFISAVLLLSTLGAEAQPLLAGHRGSSYGVESTEEAFRNGVALGYAYLETDVKVTKDIQLILTHDDDVSRFSDSGLTIAGSTLAELQALELTQTRNGVKYTGKYMTLGEYLDLCAELNVKPLIELKWATGINSNDQSNMPKLIQVIEEKGFRNKCIILTSMKPCLEWIRKNHPDITLQFLCNSLDPTGTNFAWCVEWKIDADIRSDGCNKNVVQKLHENGLKANMWTTNDEAGYKTYGNMGFDFITTDNLDGNNLPALDEATTYPPNTIDYPSLEVPVKGEYTPELISEIEYPESLANVDVKRALLRDGQWVVLGHDADKNATLVSIDPTTGTTTPISTEGIEGGEVLLNDIAFTSDGKLIGCNVETVPFDGGGNVWKLYIWNDLTAAPTVLATVDVAAMLGNWTNAYTGQTMTVSGHSNDLQVYVAARSSSGSIYRIAGIKINNGMLDTEKFCYALNNDSYNEEKWGADFLFSSTPTTRGALLVDSPTMDAVEYVFSWEGTRIPMTEIATLDATAAPAVATGISFFRRAAKVYATVPTCAEDGSKATARVYDATPNIGSLQAVTPQLHEGLGTTAGLMASAIEYDKTNKMSYIYLFAEGQGLLKLQMDEDAVVVEPDEIDVAFERVWIKSRTTDNLPEHIDGTNAQQGTAVNGYFYVNDCNDKLIYVFDESGCIGSIPGGSGWGCTRDDAGNIIVRDDKDAKTSRKFIIYPAGSMPDNYGEAVTLDVEVTLEGQTNFINASGDVLGATGRIYLYPNTQTKANIINIEKGNVTSITASGELSIAGSTAGYIVPNGNDSENWYYQVRSSGVYHYNGGVNEEIMTTKATTNPPARNTTGGFAVPVLKGNQMLLHNSGSNYKGGFTVRNLTTDKVITSIDPIGTLGYETGGNYSTFNWLIAEKVDDSEFTIYQYCPSNGMARYRLYDKNTSSVEDVALGEDNALTAVVNDDILSLAGVGENELVEVYNVAGVKVLETRGIDINVGNLASGIYIVKVGNKSLKIAK